MHASFKLLILNYKNSSGLYACKGAVSGELCHDVCSCAVPRRRSNGFLNRVLLNTYAKVLGHISGVVNHGPRRSKIQECTESFKFQKVIHNLLVLSRRHLG